MWSLLFPNFVRFKNLSRCDNFHFSVQNARTGNFLVNQCPFAIFYFKVKDVYMKKIQQKVEIDMDHLDRWFKT